jgi:16S rRNA G527 N7-methylase RsmG
MFEKNKKKAYFIKKTIRTLRLKNAKIVDKAITPELITDTLFDVVTARALAPANKIVNMSQHLLTKTGKFLLMKGDIEKIKEEVAELDINTYSYTIHKTKIKDSKKHILEINKK